MAISTDSEQPLLSPILTVNFHGGVNRPKRSESSRGHGSGGDNKTRIPGRNGPIGQSLPLAGHYARAMASRDGWPPTSDVTPTGRPTQFCPSSGWLRLLLLNGRHTVPVKANWAISAGDTPRPSTDMSHHGARIVTEIVPHPVPTSHYGVMAQLADTAAQFLSADRAFCGRSHLWVGIPPYWPGAAGHRSCQPVDFQRAWI